jgi:hypothetical protein
MMLPDERKRRIDRLKQQRLDKQKANQDLVSQLADKIEDLKKTFDLGVDIKGLDRLVDSLGEMAAFSDDVKELKAVIAALKIPNMPASVKVEGLGQFSQVIKDIKAPDQTKEFKAIYKILDSLSNKSDAAVIISNRKESEFIPMRRVRSVNGKLMWDDSLPSGGGGSVAFLYAEDRTEITGRNSATDTADTALVAAQARPVVITDIIISNTSATDTEVDIKYDSSIKLTYPAPQKSGAVHALSKPLLLPAGRVLNFAAVAGVSTMKVSVIGYLA